MNILNMSNDKDVKQDKEKLRVDLIEPEFIEELADVLTYGADKYDENSWQEIPNATNRYYAALMRHILAWRKGEDIDESGLPHLYHAAANIMFLMHFAREDANE